MWWDSEADQFVTEGFSEIIIKFIYRTLYKQQQQQVLCTNIKENKNT